MCSFCPSPKSFLWRALPWLFELSFILWCFFTASMVFFTFYIVTVQNCTELKMRVFPGFSPEGAPVSFPSCCLPPRWIPVPSQFKCLFPVSGRFRSKPPHSKAILALSYTVSELYFYCFCTFKVMSGNTLQTYCFMLKHTGIFTSDWAFVYGNSGKRLLGVCLMMEFQPKTQGNRGEWVGSAVLQVFMPLNLGFGFMCECAVDSLWPPGFMVGWRLVSSCPWIRMGWYWKRGFLWR